MNSSQELKYYLALRYVFSAQYDNPPTYPVKKVCDAIDGAPEGTDVIGRVAAGLNASVGPPCHFVYDFIPSNMSEFQWQVLIVIYLYIFSHSYFHFDCYKNEPIFILLPSFFCYDSLKFFASKMCTEMVMPIGHGANDTMFQAWPFDLNNHTKTCQGLFGVTPRPHWITTEFGGRVSFCLFLFY